MDRTQQIIELDRLQRELKVKLGEATVRLNVTEREYNEAKQEFRSLVHESHSMGLYINEIINATGRSRAFIRNILGK